jgi:hypothetical protein
MPKHDQPIVGLEALARLIELGVTTPNVKVIHAFHPAGSVGRFRGV